MLDLLRPALDYHDFGDGPVSYYTDEFNKRFCLKILGEMILYIKS